MVHVHSDQVGVVIIHPKAVKTNLSSCWSGQQNRQLSPETTGTFVLTRQDHIWRGLKAQTSNWLFWLLSERTRSFIFLDGISLDQIPTEIKLWHFCAKTGEVGDACELQAMNLLQEGGPGIWSHGSGGTSEFMANSQKNDVIFRQIFSGFNRGLSSPFPWENHPGCQIVFIRRLKPTNSDTIMSHFAGNLNICVSFFLCLKFTDASASIHFLFEYLHSSFIIYIHIMCVSICLHMYMWIYLYTYTYIRSFYAYCLL